MATSLTGTLAILANIDHVGASGLATLTDKINGMIKTWTITNGTGANQADLIWHAQRTLAASTSEDLDLSGTLTDAFGAVVAFARVKAIIVSSAAANGALIQVGGAATNQFVNWVADASDMIQIRAGGFMMLAAPDATAYAVTAATGDLLTINNTDGAAAATYDIYIIGASA